MVFKRKWCNIFELKKFTQKIIKTLQKIEKIQEDTWSEICLLGFQRFKRIFWLILMYLLIQLKRIKWTGSVLNGCSDFRNHN